MEPQLGLHILRLRESPSNRTRLTPFSLASAHTTRGLQQEEFLCRLRHLMLLCVWVPWFRNILRLSGSSTAYCSTYSSACPDQSVCFCRCRLSWTLAMSLLSWSSNHHLSCNLQRNQWRLKRACLWLTSSINVSNKKNDILIWAVIVFDNLKMSMS